MLGVNEFLVPDLPFKPETLSFITLYAALYIFLLSKTLSSFYSQSENPPVINLEEQHHEMQRQKWEQEKEELLRNPDRDIHYQNVLFDG